MLPLVSYFKTPHHILIPLLKLLVTIKKMWKYLIIFIMIQFFSPIVLVYFHHRQYL